MTTLAEVADIQTGPFGSQLHASDYRESGVPVVMPQDLEDNRISTAQIARVDESDAQRLVRHRLEPGDLVFSRRGDVTRRSIVRHENAGWLCGTGCLRVKPSLMADGRFLSYALGTEAAREWLIAHAVGATMPNLNTEILGRVPLWVPPLAEQQAIAEVLGALDDKIATNTAIAKTAEMLLATEVEGAWLSSPSRDAVLTEFVDLNPPTERPSAAEPTYVDMKRLPEHGWTIDGFDRRPPKGGARFRNGDALLARITPCLENRKTGFVDQLPDHETGLGSTEFIVLRAKPGLAAPIAFFLATSARFRDFAVQHMIGTSGRQRAAASELAGYELARPDSGWLTDFGDRANRLFAAVHSSSAENRTLAATRDALLPQLMSGKLRVRDAERTLSDAGV